MSGARRVAAVGVSCLVAVTMAGCGSGEAEGSGGSGAAARAVDAGESPGTGGASALAEPNGVDELSVDEIVARAETAMESFGSVRMTVDNPEVGFDLAADVEGNCVGSIRSGGGRMEVVKQGDDVYLKGDDAFWKGEEEDGTAAAMARMAGGRYVKTTAANPLFVRRIAETCDLEKVRAGFSGPGPDAGGENILRGLQGLAKQGVTDVDGVPAVGLKGMAETVEETVFVALRGEPYVLKVTVFEVQVLFRDYDKQVSVTVPPADETVDGSRIKE